jgi:hypothetical protein
MQKVLGMQAQSFEFLKACLDTQTKPLEPKTRAKSIIHNLLFKFAHPKIAKS